MYSISVLGKNFKNEEDLQLQVKFVRSLAGGGSQFYQSFHYLASDPIQCLRLNLVFLARISSLWITWIPSLLNLYPEVIP